MPRAPRRPDPELVAELLDEAIGQPAAERRSWITARCGGDTLLAGEVLQLIGFLPDPERPGGEDGDEPELAPGAVIGGCRLGRVLGRGGMGVVHAAQQLEPRRPVAVKTLQAGFLGPDARRRMRLEAAALARIDHPAIARVYAAGVHREPGRGGSDLPYLVLELVPEASTFAEWWRDSGESLATRLERFAQVCDGVHEAHLRGILHRDLKSANVLVGRDGQPKVIDFGVASLATPAPDEASLAETGHALVGTLANMSPEQAAGRPVDHRSDVYALGTMLYELLAGEPPYRVDRSDLPGSIRRIAETVPPPPSRREPRCRGDLDVIVATALAKDPAERYGSAEALADDLRRSLADEPIRAQPTPLPRRVVKALRRNLAVTLASTAAVLALATALIASLLAQAKTSRALFAASFANLERMAEAGEVRAARAALESLGSFGLGEPWAARVHRGEIEQATGTCDEAPPANAMALGLSSDGSLAAMAGPMDRIRIVEVSTMRKVEDLELGHDECYSVEFRENDRVVRFARLSGRVEEWSIPSRGGDGTVRTVHDFGVRPGGDFLCETFTSADGRWLCGGVNGPDGRHVAVELETGRSFDFRGLDLSDSHMAFLVAPHPQRPLFACGGDTGIAWLDLSGPEPRWIPTAFRSQTNDLRFSPDGTRLAAITHFGVHLIEVPRDLDEPVRIEPLEARVQSPWSLAWSPDGRLLAASGRTPEVVLIDAATRAVAARRYGGSGYHWRLEFTPDGRELVAASGALVKYPVVEAFPRELRPSFPGLVPAKPTVHWLDGGELIAATGPHGELDLIEPATGLSTRLVEGSARSLGTGAADPGGRFLAVGGLGRATLLFDRDTGRRHELPEIGRADLAFSPSGRWLVYTDGTRRYAVVDAARGTVVASLEIPVGLDNHGSVWVDDERCIAGNARRRTMIERDGAGRWTVREIPSQGLAAIAALPPGPDGLRWATASLGATLFGMYEFDPSRTDGSDAATVPLADLTETPRAIAGSPDGTLIAAGGSDPRIVIYDRLRRLALGSFPTRARLNDLEFSPDGQTLAAVDFRGRIELFDSRPAAEREQVRRRRETIYGLDEREFRKSLASRGWGWLVPADASPEEAASGYGVVR
jgi:WD40 repeat protein